METQTDRPLTRWLAAAILIAISAILVTGVLWLFPAGAGAAVAQARPAVHQSHTPANAG